MVRRIESTVRERQRPVPHGSALPAKRVEWGGEETNMLRGRGWLSIGAVWVVSTWGCSSSKEPDPSVPDGGPRVSVVGRIESIEDLVPVDGGVTIELKEDSGGSAILRYASMFTNPRPSEEHVDLYQVIQDADVGDRVKAEGIRTSDGIDLKALTILERAE
jgi:hypothetical protein